MDCLDRADLSAHPTLCTFFGRFGNDRNSPSFFVRAVSGNFRFCEIFGRQFFLNPPGKFPELFLILLIRSSSGILADNGMLCNGGYCSYDTAACPLCGILSSTRVSSYARLPYTHTKMAFAPFPFIMRRRFTTVPGTRPP